jgi:hypothetical protein
MQCVEKTKLQEKLCFLSVSSEDNYRTLDCRALVASVFRAMKLQNFAYNTYKPFPHNVTSFLEETAKKIWNTVARVL